MRSDSPETGRKEIIIMKNFWIKRLSAAMLSAVLIAGSITPVTVCAEEVAAEENAEGEALDAEEYIEGEVEESSGEVVMSQIASDNGREIAASFPSELLPEGFHKDSCTYEGQTIEIARLDNDESGEVVLAYLADSDGSNGDFYLCDIMTAEMKDFIQIKNGNNGYIVVLDPGDVIVAPSGFKRATFKFYGKTGTAWMLPAAKDSAKAEKGIINPFEPVEVYAASAGAGALDSLLSNITNSDQNSDEDSSDEADLSEAEEAAEKTDSKASQPKEAEDGSRIVTADPSEFIMVYAIDNTGTVGFYLYDTVQETYQRYVAINGTDSSQAEQYKADSKNRLIVICVLAVIVVIMLFIIVNLLLNRRDDDYDDEDEDEDDEEEEEPVNNRRKPERRSKKSIFSREDEEDYEDEEEDFGEDEDVSQGSGYGDTTDMWEEEEETEPVPVRRNAAPVRRQAPVKNSSSEPVFTRNGQVVKRTGVPTQTRRPEASPVVPQPRRNPEAGVVKRTAAQGMSAPVRRPSSSQENVEQRSVVPKRRPAAQGASNGAQVRRPRPNGSQMPAQGRPAGGRPKPAPRPRPDLDEDFDFDLD